MDGGKAIFLRHLETFDEGAIETIQNGGKIVGGLAGQQRYS